MQAVAWQMPWLFRAIANSGLLPAYDDMHAMVQQNGNPTDLEKACTVLHTPDIALVWSALGPIVAGVLLVISGSVKVLFSLVMTAIAWPT